MLVTEFIAALDAIRSSVRTDNPKLKGELLGTDAAVQQLLQLAKDIVMLPVPTGTVKAASVGAPLDDYLALAPAEQEAPQQQETPKVLEIVERGDGEGRMIVMGRDKPFVPKKPVLEEVQEGELGK
jgi:hypothetical protein